MKPFGQWLNDLTKELQKEDFGDGPEELNQYEVDGYTIGYNAAIDAYLFFHEGVSRGRCYELDLVVHNWGEHPIDYTYPCRVCDFECDINCNPWEWDPDYHYCGRSPSCCP